MTLGIVVIGRNEGERLRVCLESVVGYGKRVVYVDSGSSDSSVELARSLGAEVVELDLSIPFTAARARNAGFDRLIELDPGVAIIQFVDGDCEIVLGWIDRASAELEAGEDAAIVCGRVRERHPERSIYNRLADLEWDTPIGEAEACGGIFAIKAKAFRDVGGFDPTLIAGEEPELCCRLRRVGWRVFRLDLEMATHDMAMTRLGQWWRRQVRFGYAESDVTRRHRNGPFAVQARRARIWTLGWSIALLLAVGLAAFFREPISAMGCAIVAVAPVAQALRAAARARRRLPQWSDALAHGGLVVMGKWAESFGQGRYMRDRLVNRKARVIEYKLPPMAEASS